MHTIVSDELSSWFCALPNIRKWFDHVIYDKLFNIKKKFCAGKIVILR